MLCCIDPYDGNTLPITQKVGRFLPKGWPPFRFLIPALAGQHAKFHELLVASSRQQREKTGLCEEMDKSLVHGERKRLVVLAHVFLQHAVYLAVFGILVLFE